MTVISTMPSTSGAKASSKGGASLDPLTGILSSEAGVAGAGDFAALIGDLTGETDVREKADGTLETHTPELRVDGALAGIAGFVAAQVPAPIGVQDAGSQSSDAVGLVEEGPALSPARAARASTIVLSEDYADAARRALTGTGTDQAGEAKPAMAGNAATSEDEALKSAVAALTVPEVAPRTAHRANGGASAQGGSGAQGTGGANTNLLSTLADAARNDNSRQGAGEGKQDGERRFAPGAPAGIGQALSDIVGSLPPIVQTQIGLPGASAIAVVQQASAAQALDAQVIDMGVSGQWIDRMAQEISTLAEGAGHSRFTLMPPHLGRIEISLSQSELSTAVHFATETDEAAERIRAAQGNLQADARLSALSIGSITVEKSQQSFDQATRDGGAGTGQPRQGADGGAQAGAQSQSGGQGGLGRESKTSARRDVNHLSEAPEQARRAASVANPGVRFA
ncbi:flagellar hook-length control protein FliK [Sphingobium sp. CR28]|uniref:flagellar hook-length control protein FliK n=1 Tax=Sphingobium sp. CR28 TaxID=3400272 RepID=UPI003FEFFB45